MGLIGIPTGKGGVRVVQTPETPSMDPLTPDEELLLHLWDQLTALRERVKRMEEALRDTFDPLQHMVVCQKRLMGRCMCNECIEERAQASLKEGE